MASYIAVEGCLAVGKTTMALELSKKLKADLLLEDFSKHPFLPEFYRNPSANGLETELAFSIIHYHTIAGAARSGRFRHDLVSDFFYEKTMIFHKVTLSPRGDAKVFENLWTGLRERLPTPDLVLYLEAPTEFILKRVRMRDRAYERPVTYEYLDRVNKAYAKFMARYDKSRVVTLDAEKLDNQANPDPFGTVADLVRNSLAKKRK